MLSREIEILNEFKNGRVDGILISVSKETKNIDHINEAMESGLPLVFLTGYAMQLMQQRLLPMILKAAMKQPIT